MPRYDFICRKECGGCGSILRDVIRPMSLSEETQECEKCGHNMSRLYDQQGHQITMNKTLGKILDSAQRKPKKWFREQSLKKGDRK